MNEFSIIGEHIKNWRRRYFVLRDDGSYFGFREKPTHDMQEPLNNFTVKGELVFIVTLTISISSQTRIQLITVK